jgi:hypothetical protein
MSSDVGMSHSHVMMKHIIVKFSFPIIYTHFCCLAQKLCTTENYFAQLSASHEKNFSSENISTEKNKAPIGLLQKW